ncbi:methanol/ethanol family PQQ-dependent dehydrogenase [Oharaeibacter diazotrophicus]|uniref:Alcohol dehydrogenase (Cytochrome c) n=1 Tax=Oharaeibacter diazotrophicus TaxID=1920512 RepID=A0A4R6RH03_9HYPH|nr:methanol/ethanol family PQQ-dependent dehydrogenase [Oharaeibacter diazotrophicus]TDP85582.1 alcohol dehydrogenase (cytochrome c) [Oharaeibacter diazotrophicus]BBE74553.1 methanol dehydrogenase [cytochrome c] subunit 1 precursor [Pleomorphomonas sp. SM30]GLS75748.1 methanol dehydrogenase [Oharaeibacter diazotrophicus]
MSRRPSTVLAAALVLAAATPPAAANGDLLRRSADSAEWALPTGDYAGTRWSALDEITTANVKDLRPAWSFSTGVLRGHEGAPLVVDGVMYLVTPFPNVVYALDLAHDGTVLWRYEPRQDAQAVAVMCCDTVHKGLAYADGAIVFEQADATLVALDALTGALRWSVRNGDVGRGETNTAAVMPVKDMVIVGMAGGEMGARCHLSAYEAATGRLRWRAWSTGPDADTLIDPAKTTELGRPVGPDSGTAGWDGETWTIGGGCTWGWFTYDPDLDLVYYGTGNPANWNPVQRPGDNRWTDALIARDADTGVARWVYQMTPHDEWDYDGVNELILTDHEIDGTRRKLVTHFDRNGFAYTLDRATGALIRADKFDPSVNWARAVDLDPASPGYGRPILDPAFSTDDGGAGEDVNHEGICPGSLGAKNQQPAAYSPRTGLFYVPLTHVCMDFEPFQVNYTAGQPYVGATLKLYPDPARPGAMGGLMAFDPATGKAAFEIDERFSVWSGALATAGGLVFYGTLEGWLKAIDARTGEELWRFKTPSGIVGNVMTYAFGGRQYVAVLSGVGGWAGIGLAAGLTDPLDGSGAVGAYEALSKYTTTGGVLTVFSLP